MIGRGTVVENLDGSRTEYFAVDPSEATLLALARELFEDHWPHVIFGPCIEGAVFEDCFSERPRLSLLDGYLTVEVVGGSWHFHLCIGPHVDTPDWTRLDLWMRLRERYAGVPVEAPPTRAQRPRTH